MLSLCRHFPPHVRIVFLCSFMFEICMLVVSLECSQLQVYEVLRSCFTAFEVLSWLVCIHSVDSSHFYVEMDPDIWASKPIWVLVIGSEGTSGFEDEEYSRPVDSEAYFLGIHFAGAPAKHISREFTSHKTTS